MRVLVPGAFGYIGLALLRRLAREHTVLAYGRGLTAVTRVVPENVRLAVDTVHDIYAQEDFDAVIHLVGSGGPQRCAAHPVDAIRSFSNLIEWTRRPRCRAIIASSIYVYGPRDRPSVETDRTEPTELYGALKEASEALGHTALRLSNVYGVGAPIDLGRDSAVDRFARAAAIGGEMLVHGGSQLVDYVHIDDAVEAFVLAISAPIATAAINIGGGTPEPLLTIAERCLTIGRERGTMPTTARICKTESNASRCLDISLAERAIGWKPRVPFDRGLRELVEFYGGKR